MLWRPLFRPRWFLPQVCSCCGHAVSSCCDHALSSCCDHSVCSCCDHALSSCCNYAVSSCCDHAVLFLLWHPLYRARRFLPWVWSGGLQNMRMTLYAILSMLGKCQPCRGSGNCRWGTIGTQSGIPARLEGKNTVMRLSVRLEGRT